ncbi:MAG: HPr family phosphocarrier protein [Lachnospiraceae bacterium]|nr:HPr family phosphocarrier protein [Lachnospiraceae bacterium]MDE7201096.1 HPr family phosphocarrier protein [Lachnospiraceae bacterium]
MFTVKILINSIDRAKKFTSIVSKLDADMDIICGRYVINAKSIVGIFTINLSQPVELRIHKDREDAEKVVEKLRDYLV